MYGKEYWHRAGISHIFEFIRTGGLLLCDDAKKKTAEDRHKDYECVQVGATIFSKYFFKPKPILPQRAENLHSSPIFTKITAPNNFYIVLIMD